MRWRGVKASASRAKERANISFFIFVIFFGVFGVIVLTELFLLEKPGAHTSKSRYDTSGQNWYAWTESNTDTGEPPPPARAPVDGVWQPVAGTRFKFFVYSAYLERRTVDAVRVIAATKTRGPDAVVCRLWLPTNKTVMLRARVKAIRENWNMKYSATYVLCLLRNSGVKPEDTVGAAISVLSAMAPTRAPTNMLTVLDTEVKEGIEETIHVCVKPLHNTYATADWLMEWFEMNRLLGVSHFYMYNVSMHPNVSCLINHYQKQGLITILPWKLPLTMTSVVEIRTQGQFAAFNDCLYRSMSSAGWLLVIDVDELVLPRRERTLQALINSLRALYHKPWKVPDALLFRNAFFYRMWDDDTEAPNSLVTCRKTRRWAVPHALKNRSKYVVRPSKAVELGNHFLWEMVSQSVSVGAPIDRALVHHYREVCEFDGLQCLTVPSTVDRTAHRWADQLNKRVTDLRNRLFYKCN